MIKLHRIATFTLACVAAVVASGALPVPHASAFEIGADELRRLKAREVLVNVVPDDSGEADGQIEAVIDVAAPPAKVWTVMLDCQRALKFMEGLKSCRVLERGPNDAWDIREHKSKWLAILPELRSVFRSEYLRDKEIKFQRVAGDIKVLQGGWRLEPLTGGTSTRLTSHSRIGLSAPIPGFILRGALESDVPKRLRALREDVENGK